MSPLVNSIYLFIQYWVLSIKPPNLMSKVLLKQCCPFFCDTRPTPKYFWFLQNIVNFLIR